jgi:carbamoyl-phosphate synthase/aspartate carbamoyltransferase/dihydroorotase
VHSLARLLRLYDVKINYIAPEILRMPAALVDELSRQGVVQAEHTSLEESLPQSDVLYVTRVQKERFEDLDQYEGVKSAFVITPATLKQAKERMIVMHPLPRVGEIALEVDEDPRAAYFRQVECGLYVRMALLAMVLGKA